MKNINDKILYTVIVPTFNRGMVIGNAIKSITSQGFDNYEIIIVDDFSTDDTEKIVREFSKINFRIKYFKNSNTKGPSGARNTGLAHAKGEFIAFLDSDDIWLPGFFDISNKVFNTHNSMHVLFSNFYIKDYKTGEVVSIFFDNITSLQGLNSHEIEKGIRSIDGSIIDGLLQENFFSLCGTVFRKNIIKNIYFSEKCKYGEDRDFAIRVALQNNGNFSYRVAPSFVAFRHGDNICSGNSNINNRILASENGIYLFLSYLKLYPLTPIQKIFLKNSLEKHFEILKWAYRRTFNFKKYFIYLILKRKVFKEL